MVLNTAIGFTVMLALAACTTEGLYQTRALPAKAKNVPAPRQELKVVSAERYMISAANPLATKAGFEMLEAGGSAVDAAIAAQLVLTLVEPQSSGIGGGAYILHYESKSGEIAAWDGRETAPAAARADMFLDKTGKPVPFKEAAIGGWSVAVPSLIRLFADIHQEQGRLPWARLFEPAIKLADNGFPVSPRLTKMIGRAKDLKEMEGTRSYFLDHRHQPLKPGTPLVNKDYADTLRLIAKGGPDAFYKGPLAQKMVDAVRQSDRNPGALSLDDLASYKAIKREPVCLFYRVSLVCSMPPSSSGGLATLQILGLLQPFDLASLAPDSAQALHLIAEASRLAYADRYHYVADSDFVSVPMAGLLDPAYLAGRSALISKTKSMGKAKPGIPPGVTAAYAPDSGHPEATSTTHLSVVDAWGNALSMTSSIETIFGSKIMVGGFLLNNHMTDFSFQLEKNGLPIANRVEPGKRPRSSMSPTLVFGQDGKVKLVIGSPGGSRIIGFVAKALIAHLDWGLDVQQAISLGNVNNRNGITELEKGTTLTHRKAALEALGHNVRVKAITSGLHGISIDADGLKGGADPRREGLVMGR